MVKTTILDSLPERVEWLPFLALKASIPTETDGSFLANDYLRRHF